jgi:Peptidase family M23
MFLVLLMLPGALAHAASPGAAASRPAAHAPASPAARAPASPAARAPASPAAHPTWRWPLRGPVVGSFHLTPGAPYARGQRRGIEVAAAPGTRVLAACPGRVTFAGAVPGFGPAVSVRCGALVATYLRLGRVAARRGAPVAVGQPLGTLGSAGVLRLGARRASDRRGYLDPLLLLRDPRPAAPRVLMPPRPRHPRAPATPHPAPRRIPHAPVAPHPAPRGVPHVPGAPHPTPAAPPSAAPGGLPWPAYPALAIIASALPLGGVVQRRRRRTRAPAAAAAHEGP